MDLGDIKTHSHIINEDAGFDKTDPDNTFALELQKIIQQETSGGKTRDDVLAEAIATVDVDLPYLSNVSSPGLVYATNKPIDPHSHGGKETDLTVEHILGDLQAGTEDDKEFTEKLNRLLFAPDGLKRSFQDDIEIELTSNKKHKSVYETLSPPESMSPLSDKNDIQQNRDLNTHKDFSAIKRKINSQRMLKQVPLPPKLTNEFTMTQVAEMKKRIINTHKLILNFNFLKDGYARSCEELSKTVVKLKDSEFDRARLVKENEDLRKMVLEMSKQLKE
ncbi:unnamed protein product [Kluyveromyces dobzhanskii CBS 2104]|uniref:WGS project CCBQ000000000 data, contig 00049 n=1 Tax=Kluyveromyces dobzhanskii CBS 2104 TaxID=1427455 RepID=A0A0A8L567_9SACH|nr:unnamed protein product [Kluyveromyces dobzhanskii CBS 2104]